MLKRTICLFIPFVMLMQGGLEARDLTEATFTQVVNDVVVTNEQGGLRRAPVVNDAFHSPEIITTGPDSRAELTAPDQTVTRIGANTVFSFKPTGRGIALQKGSVLFNSPKGRGGGMIQTRSATAAVLGTTIIVSATPNGGFKMLVLEGHGQITLPNGRIVPVNAGQLSFVLPGATGLPPVFDFRLSKLLGGSNLTGGFNNHLPSQNKITAAETFQEHQIATGNAKDTGLMFGEVVGNQVQLIDPNTQQNFVNNNNLNNILSFADLISTDALINSPTLDQTRIIQFNAAFEAAFTDTNQPTDFNLEAFDFFVAHNLTISTTLVDLSPFKGDSGFIFFSSGDTTITGNTSFANSPPFVGIVSLGGITIAPGSTLQFDSFQAALLASNDLNFNNVSLIDTGGKLFIGSNGSITLLGGLLSGNSNSASTDASISVHAGQDVNATGTTLADAGVGGVHMKAGGNVNLVDVNSNGPNSDFLIDNDSGGQNNPVGGFISITGGAYNGANFSAFANADVTIDSATLNMANINIQSVVGNISLTNGSFTASSNINATTQGNMVVQGGNFSAGNAVNLFAGNGINNSLSVSGVNFTSAAQISLQAYTLVIGNGASFPAGSIVNLFSFLGSTGGNLPNFGSVQSGRVNFVGGSPNSVKYGGTPIGTASTYAIFNSQSSNLGKVNILKLPGSVSVGTGAF